jgi:putative transposase
LRHGLAFASWKERRDVAAALKPVYRAANADLAREQLEAFATGPWGKRYPAIAPAWAAPVGAGDPVLRLPR